MHSSANHERNTNVPTRHWIIEDLILCAEILPGLWLVRRLLDHTTSLDIDSSPAQWHNGETLA
jgi:hypothetical protein